MNRKALELSAIINFLFVVKQITRQSPHQMRRQLQCTVSKRPQPLMASHR